MTLRLGPTNGPRRHALPQADLSAFFAGTGQAEPPGFSFFVADYLIRTLIEKRADPVRLAATRSLLVHWLEEQE